MADVRVLEGVKIVDAVTPANSANVDGSGNLAVILAANTGVDIGDVDVLSVIPGVGATNLGKAVDAVAGAADSGVATLAVRDDALGGLSEAELDYVQLRTDANGALWTHDDALDAALAGNELQVDIVAALPTGTNEIGDVRAITTSVTPGTAAANLGKAENAASAAGDTLVAMAAVQDATLSALASIDGDYTQLRVNANGALWVEQVAGGSGTSAVDDALFTTGTDSYTPMGGILDETTPNNLEENDGGVVRMTANRAMHTALRDGAGNERSANVTASNELNVLASAQPGVDIGDVTIADFAAAETEADDDIVAAAQTSLRTLNLLYGYDGTQWERLQTDANGALDVNITAGGGEALPTNPVRTTGNSTDTAAAGTFTLDGPSSDGTTTTVRGFDACASVPVKAELQTVANGAGTTILTMFAQAGERLEWRAPHRDYFDTAHPSNAGFDGFRVVLTNLDNENAANLYATLYTED